MRNWILSIERWTRGANEVVNDREARLRRRFGALPCAGICWVWFISAPGPAGTACLSLRAARSASCANSFACLFLKNTAIAFHPSTAHQPHAIPAIAQYLGSVHFMPRVSIQSMVKTLKVEKKKWLKTGRGI